MQNHQLTGAEACLFTHATIITVNRDRHVILDGAMLTRDGRISAIGKTADLISKYVDEGISMSPSGIRVIDCTNQIMIPGLINTHAHLAQSLLRGLAEDLNLHSWLCDAIWPLEANYAESDGYVAALLTIAEMLKTGTTCFLEAMLTHRSGVDNVVRAIKETGIRACLVRIFPYSLDRSIILTGATRANLSKHQNRIPTST
jgi:cytosine/adenosine deaminase-related metal-dependent hydrolase